MAGRMPQRRSTFDVTGQERIAIGVAGAPAALSARGFLRQRKREREKE